MKNGGATPLHIASLLALFTLYACQAGPRPGQEAEPRVRVLQVDGYPMTYAEDGAGATIVFVHGSLHDYRYWSRELRSLSNRFRVVAPSLRHYYPEHWDGEGSDFSRAQHSADLAVFIRRLNVGPVFLVGHSSGGLVALDTALTHPELVRKLVLMEAPLVSLHSAPGRDLSGARLARAKATVALFNSSGVESGLESYTDAVNGAGSWKRLTEEQRQMARDNAMTVKGEAHEGLQTYTCTEVARLKMPVLLLAGATSPPALKRIMAATRKCMPAASFVELQNAAHRMNEMNPAAFDNALVAFLSN